MTDWSDRPWALDISHHNGQIDWPKVAVQQPACVFLKATERRWVDPMFEQNRESCSNLGLLWLPYVFLRPDDDAATFRYLMDVIGDTSIPVALDWEAPGVPSRVVEGWIDALDAHGFRTPIAYYGAYPPAAATAEIARCPRWYPQYPGSATAASRLPMWDGSPDPDWRKFWLIWQWSDKGGVNGIGGNVDINRLACSTEMFERWYRTGRFDAAAGEQPLVPESLLPEAIAKARELQSLWARIDLGNGPLYQGAIDGWIGDRSAKAGTAAYQEWKRQGGQ